MNASGVPDWKYQAQNAIAGTTFGGVIGQCTIFSGSFRWFSDVFGASAAFAVHPPNFIQSGRGMPGSACTQVMGPTPTFSGIA